MHSQCEHGTKGQPLFLSVVDLMHCAICGHLNHLVKGLCMGVINPLSMVPVRMEHCTRPHDSHGGSASKGSVGIRALHPIGVGALVSCARAFCERVRFRALASEIDVTLHCFSERFL